MRKQLFFWGLHNRGILPEKNLGAFVFHASILSEHSAVIRTKQKKISKQKQKKAQ